MKKVFFCALVAVAVTVALTFTACNNSASGSGQAGEITFDTLNVEGVFALPAGSGDSSDLRYEVTFVYPSQYGDKAVLKKLQKKFIRYTLSWSLDGLGQVDRNYKASLTPKNAVDACIAHWKKEFQKEAAEAADQSIHRLVRMRNLIPFVNEDMLQLEVICDGEAGGPHPYNEIKNHLLGLKTGDDYKRDDVFKPEAADDIKRLISQDLLVDLESPSIEEAGVDMDNIWRERTNFQIREDGILFNYSRSELVNWHAPSAFIPYSKILPYLRDGALARDYAKKAAGGQKTEQADTTATPRDSVRVIDKTCIIFINDISESTEENVDESGDAGYYESKAREQFEKLGVKERVDFPADKNEKYLSFALDNGKSYVVHKKDINTSLMLYKKGKEPISVGLGYEIIAINELKGYAKYLQINLSEAMKMLGYYESGADFTDPRNDKTYKTVVMQGTRWMAQNLNYKPEMGGVWAYADNEANREKYGLLYDWETAKAACPAGWHLSTRNDWAFLVTTAGGSDDFGNMLKAKSGWDSNGNGTDAFGFSALPGGRRYPGGNFSGVGDIGDWWTATETEVGDGNAYYRRMGASNAEVYEYSVGKGFGFSVRCVAD